MGIEYRNKPSYCGCCGGRIPAGKIRWTRSGECPGHINPDGGLCGAIVETLTPSRKWARAQEERRLAVATRRA